MAKDNGFPFRFHVLTWGAQQPTWMDNLSPANQLLEIKQWCAAVAQRYPAPKTWPAWPPAPTP
ncbi:MAG: hypothetical protein EOO62_06850 [Hymenobacter sp.]|nr:MAG: hypothetical protein EOO62_06850 [Hymenobacter sp.]